MIVESPCIANCCLDDEDVCLGCCRTLDEILVWSASSNEQKLQIIDKAKARKLSRQASQDNGYGS